MAPADTLSSIRKRVVDRDFLTYGLLMALAMAAAVGKSLLYARVLDPTGFGLYTLAVLVTMLGQYAASFGITDGLFREVPVLRGRGGDAAAVEIRSAGITASYALSVVAGALLTAGCLVATRGRADLQGLEWAGPMLVGTVTLNVMLLDLRARELSAAYGMFLFLKSAAAAAVAVPLAAAFGAAGVMAGESGVSLACAGLCRLRWGRDLRWSFGRPGELRRLVRLGLPFTGSNVLQNLAMSADRWAVQLRFGTDTLGRYSFAMLLASLGLVALNVLQQYAHPRLLRGFGQTGDHATVARKARWMAGGVGAVAVLGAAPVIYGFEWFMRAYYPQYEGAEALIPYVYLGTALMALSFFDVLFFAHGDGRLLIVSHGTVLAVQGIAYAAAAFFEAPLIAYAVIYAVGRFTAVTLGWILGLHALARRPVPASPDHRAPAVEL